jgi:hypothetical protein
MAFDGANMWVVNLGDQTVTKLRASDGKNLGTFPTTSNGYGIAFDGANIWVAGEPYIVELQPSDGKLIFFTRLPYNGGDGALAFDGANIWAAGYSGDFVSKL